MTDNRNFVKLEEIAELLGFEPCRFMYLDDGSLRCYKTEGEINERCDYNCEEFQRRMNPYINRECYDENDES